jgi:hypothetical protein
MSGKAKGEKESTQEGERQTEARQTIRHDLWGEDDKERRGKR